MTSYQRILAVVVGYLCFVKGQSSCRPAQGGDGSCVVYNECPSLHKLMRNRNPQDVNLLRQSFCGYEGRKVKLCCPGLCQTPDGQNGQCTGLYSCPHLIAMLERKPVPPQVTTFLQRSVCQGPEKYSVCCGEKPPSILPAAEPEVTSIEPTYEELELNKRCSSLTAFPPNPSSQCCGKESSVLDRIIGGNETSIDEYPWLALIEYRGPDDSIKLLCGGVLISAKYVLTAAHCVIGPVLNYGTPINVRLGEYDTSKDGADCTLSDGGGQDCTEGIVVLPIEKTIPHNGYDPANELKRNDIALIRLKKNAPFTDFIRPVCLPTEDATLDSAAQFKLYAAGWGAVSETESSSKIKLHVDLPYVSLKKCQPSYNVVRRQKVTLWPGQICAGGVRGKDSCRGDSGGPLMYQNSAKTFEVLGIVSFGPSPCGQENIPGVYSKVYFYNDWIRSQIKA